MFLGFNIIAFFVNLDDLSRNIEHETGTFTKESFCAIHQLILLLCPNVVTKSFVVYFFIY